MYHALAWVWAFVVGMRDYLWALLLCGLSGDRVKIRGESYRVLRHIADGGFSQVLAVRRGGGSGETFAVKKIILQSESKVEGDLYHKSLAIEQGAYFEGKSRRVEDPLAGIQRPELPSASASAN